MRVILHASCLTQNPSNHITIHGSEGTFTEKNLDLQESNLLKGLDPVSYQNFYIEMAEAILNNAPVPVKAEEALAVIKIIHQIETQSLNQFSQSIQIENSFPLLK